MDNDKVKSLTSMELPQPRTWCDEHVQTQLEKICFPQNKPKGDQAFLSASSGTDGLLAEPEMFSTQVKSSMSGSCVVMSSNSEQERLGNPYEDLCSAHIGHLDGASPVEEHCTSQSVSDLIAHEDVAISGGYPGSLAKLFDALRLELLQLSKPCESFPRDQLLTTAQQTIELLKEEEASLACEARSVLSQTVAAYCRLVSLGCCLQRSRRKHGLKFSISLTSLECSAFVSHSLLALVKHSAANYRRKVSSDAGCLLVQDNPTLNCLQTSFITLSDIAESSDGRASLSVGATSSLGLGKDVPERNGVQDSAPSCAPLIPSLAVGNHVEVDNIQSVTSSCFELYARASDSGQSDHSLKVSCHERNREPDLHILRSCVSSESDEDDLTSDSSLSSSRGLLGSPPVCESDSCSDSDLERSSADASKYDTSVKVTEELREASGKSVLSNKHAGLDSILIRLKSVLNKSSLGSENSLPETLPFAKSSSRGLDSANSCEQTVDECAAPEIFAPIVRDILDDLCSTVDNSSPRLLTKHGVLPNMLANDSTIGAIVTMKVPAGLSDVVEASTPSILEVPCLKGSNNKDFADINADCICNQPIRGSCAIPSETYGQHPGPENLLDRQEDSMFEKKKESKPAPGKSDLVVLQGKQEPDGGTLHKQCRFFMETPEELCIIIDSIITYLCCSVDGSLEATLTVKSASPCSNVSIHSRACSPPNISPYVIDLQSAAGHGSAGHCEETRMVASGTVKPSSVAIEGMDYHCCAVCLKLEQKCESSDVCVREFAKNSRGSVRTVLHKRSCSNLSRTAMSIKAPACKSDFGAVGDASAQCMRLGFADDCFLLDSSDNLSDNMSLDSPMHDSPSADLQHLTSDLFAYQAKGPGSIDTVANVAENLPHFEAGLPLLPGSNSSLCEKSADVHSNFLRGQDSSCSHSDDLLKPQNSLMPPVETDLALSSHANGCTDSLSKTDPCPSIRSKPLFTSMEADFQQPIDCGCLEDKTVCEPNALSVVRQSDIGCDSGVVDTPCAAIPVLKPLGAGKSFSLRACEPSTYEERIVEICDDDMECSSACHMVRDFGSAEALSPGPIVIEEDVPSRSLSAPVLEIPASLDATRTVANSLDALVQKSLWPVQNCSRPVKFQHGQISSARETSSPEVVLIENAEDPDSPSSFLLSGEGRPSHGKQHAVASGKIISGALYESPKSPPPNRNSRNCLPIYVPECMQAAVTRTAVIQSQSWIDLTVDSDSEEDVIIVGETLSPTSPCDKEISPVTVAPSKFSGSQPQYVQSRLGPRLNGSAKTSHLPQTVNVIENCMNQITSQTKSFPLPANARATLNFPAFASRPPLPNPSLDEAISKEICAIAEGIRDDNIASKDSCGYSRIVRRSKGLVAGSMSRGSGEFAIKKGHHLKPVLCGLDAYDCTASRHLRSTSISENCGQNSLAFRGSKTQPAVRTFARKPAPTKSCRSINILASKSSCAADTVDFDDNDSSHGSIFLSASRSQSFSDHKVVKRSPSNLSLAVASTSLEASSDKTCSSSRPRLLGKDSGERDPACSPTVSLSSSSSHFSGRFVADTESCTPATEEVPCNFVSNVSEFCRASEPSYIRKSDSSRHKASRTSNRFDVGIRNAKRLREHSERHSPSQRLHVMMKKKEKLDYISLRLERDIRKLAKGLSPSSAVSKIGVLDSANAMGATFWNKNITSRSGHSSHDVTANAGGALNANSICFPRDPLSGKHEAPLVRRSVAFKRFLNADLHYAGAKRIKFLSLPPPMVTENVQTDEIRDTAKKRAKHHLERLSGKHQLQYSSLRTSKSNAEVAYGPCEGFPGKLRIDSGIRKLNKMRSRSDSATHRSKLGAFAKRYRADPALDDALKSGSFEVNGGSSCESPRWRRASVSTCKNIRESHRSRGYYVSCEASDKPVPSAEVLTATPEKQAIFPGIFSSADFTEQVVSDASETEFFCSDALVVATTSSTFVDPLNVKTCASNKEADSDKEPCSLPSMHCSSETVNIVASGGEPDSFDNKEHQNARKDSKVDCCMRGDNKGTPGLESKGRLAERKTCVVLLESIPASVLKRYQAGDGMCCELSCSADRLLGGEACENSLVRTGFTNVRESSAPNSCASDHGLQTPRLEQVVSDASETEFDRSWLNVLSSNDATLKSESSPQVPCSSRNLVNSGDDESACVKKTDRSITVDSAKLHRLTQKIVLCRK